MPLHKPRDCYEIKYHCFVSYTTRESEVELLKPIVDDFIDMLKSRRLRTYEVSLFYDHMSLPPLSTHNDLYRELSEAIESSVCMLSFVSPNYFHSEWCHLEWHYMSQVAKVRGPLSPILPIYWICRSSDIDSPEIDSPDWTPAPSNIVGLNMCGRDRGNRRFFLPRRGEERYIQALDDTIGFVKRQTKQLAKCHSSNVKIIPSDFLYNWPD